MKRIFPLLIVILVATLSEFCCAQDIARVRNEVESKEASWVGQRVPFHIDLMSASFFSGTAHFDLPEIPGVILMKVKGSPTVTSESVDDDTWSVQRHRFMAFAHRAGQFEIPPFEVRFTVSEGFGKPTKPQRIKTSAMKFESKLPPGAEGYSLLVSTKELKATETWSPKPNEKKKVELYVGDAISRKIAMEVTDIPAMALPRIPFPEIEGLTRYPDSPVLDDKEYRGSLTGKRTESVTYVCEREGEYEIPGMVISWWDIEKKKLQKETFPGIRLSVKPDPNRAVESSEEVESADAGQGTGRIVTIIFAILGMFAIVYFGWRFIDNRVIKVAGIRRRQVSEPRLFSKVVAACGENDPVQAYDVLMRWIEHSMDGPNTPTLTSYLKKSGNDAELGRQFDLLQQAIVGKSISWSGEELVMALMNTRGQHRVRGNRSQQPVLPPMNPAKS